MYIENVRRAIMKKKLKALRLFMTKTAAVVLIAVLATGMGFSYAENLSEQTTDVISRSAEAGTLTLPRLIAHAGGEISGIRLTNSLQAFYNSYDRGFRFFETDISKTSDGVPVLVHDWGNANWLRNIKYSTKAATYEEFKSTKTILGLKLMDISLLLEWLSKHPDAYVITDIKEDNIGVLSTIRDLYPKTAGQIIPQIYSFEEYDTVKALGYEHIILTLYKLDAPADKVINFVNSHELFALTMSEDRAAPDYVKQFENIRIPIYVHAVNDFDVYQKLRDSGIYGVYTDYFQPSEWIE